MDGKMHGIPACRHLLHGYCLSHLTLRSAQTVQLRGFPRVLGASVRGDVELLDAVIGLVFFSVLGTDMEPLLPLQVSKAVKSTRGLKSGWSRDGFGVDVPRWTG